MTKEELSANEDRVRRAIEGQDRRANDKYEAAQRAKDIRALRDLLGASYYWKRWACSFSVAELLGHYYKAKEYAETYWYPDHKCEYDCLCIDPHCILCCKKVSQRFQEGVIKYMSNIGSKR